MDRAHLFTKIMDDAFNNYEGDITILEKASGVLFMGMLVGWKPLYLIHCNKTLRRYQKILGIRFRDCLDDYTDDSIRMEVVRDFAAEYKHNFGKVAKGDYLIKCSNYINKKLIS